MQQLTGPPREHLSAAQVTNLLTADVVGYRAGLDLLRPDLTLQRDISSDLFGGTLRYQLNGEPHSTCTLALGRELVWGVDLVRPWTELTDPTTGVTGRFHQGAFALTTPRDEVGSGQWEVTGYDRLYLLRRLVNRTYLVAAGTGYLAAVRQVLTDAGVTGVLLDATSTETLPQDRIWPLTPAQTGEDDSSPTTWLRIVNDLLRAIDYRGLYCDEVGRYRSEPYQAPAVRPVEFRFDSHGPRTILLRERTRTADVWATPNEWLFVRRNLPGDPPPEPAINAGLAFRENVSDGPTSKQARGLTWPVRYEYDASSQAVLERLADRRVAADRRVQTLYETRTGPFPVGGHADVFLYADQALGRPRKVQATGRDVDLLAGTVRWTWEQVE